ncbi:hypothetical protein [Vibrio coralliirubri]|uniref:hypothetical protein n=1 Tax=Vibrio coralliirubri TaxID=1516159 RepID=UPI000A3A98C1|nr:hypothetical protein [Vibrio coralliirubri]
MKTETKIYLINLVALIVAIAMVNVILRRSEDSRSEQLKVDIVSNVNYLTGAVANLHSSVEDFKLSNQNMQGQLSTLMGSKWSCLVALIVLKVTLRACVVKCAKRFR